MKPNPGAVWLARNQSHLVRAFDTLGTRLGATASPDLPDDDGTMEPPPAIEMLVRLFGLSPFERDLLLLCAGVEMDASLAARCADLGRDPPRSGITFALAMAVLSDPHWSAFAPSAPLRRFRLIELQPGHGVTSAPLHIDERILHYLAGVNQLDQRLERMLLRHAPPAWMAEEHHAVANDAIDPPMGGALFSTAVHLCGDDASGQEDVAAAIAARTGRELFVLRHEDTPQSAAEMDQFLDLWQRESRLLPALLLLQWADEAPVAAARQLVERLPAPLMIASRDQLRLHRTVRQYVVNKPAPSGQKLLWQHALAAEAGDLDAVVDDMSEQFRLSASAIASIAAAARPSGDRVAGNKTAEWLWDACRAFSRPQLETLAERIIPSSDWDDLVLPPAQKQTLRQMAAQSRHRMTVYETWGFAAKGRRGLGLSALFSGPSGTGKTLAAEVLAGALKLDLYRIDLSAVVSKYIGETEKNLKQVFDAAEGGGVLLLFDEADALFGKRAEVKDSHDRYANIEVGYLLQRMESFQGLAILTTNLKSSLDKAFQRRLRFSVDFPFPDAAQREAIWARVFPAKTPTSDLLPNRLASLSMAGGNIRNIALNAAFLAAGSGLPVRMAHVLQATQLEAVKIERPLSESEIRGWV